MRLTVRFAAFVALACTMALPAHAEYAVLTSGTRLHINGFERVGDRVLLHLQGGIVSVASEEVLRIEPEEVYDPVVVSIVPIVPDDRNSMAPYADFIKAAAAKYSLDPKLLESVMAAESNFNPRAISRRNALGLMQLLPETAQRMAVKNPFDPAQNIEGGARYLRLMLDRFSGNLTLALAAYNAGPDKVTLYGGVPPFRETVDYIRRVMQRLAKSAPTNSLPLGSLPVGSLPAGPPTPHSAPKTSQR